MGFGNIGPATWLAPAWRAGAASAIIPMLGARGEIDVFTGNHLGLGSAQDLVRRAWDLERLALDYQRIVDEGEALLARQWSFAGMEREAFVELTRFAGEFRHLMQDDPGLPLEVAPHGWAGWRARRLAAALGDALHDPALDYVEQVIRRGASSVRLASPFGSHAKESATVGA
jgi:phenylacetic acid degradation operon negative regulatory protein